MYTLKEITHSKILIRVYNLIQFVETVDNSTCHTNRKKLNNYTFYMINHRSTLLG